jgi:hypothetical protein
LGPRVDEGRGGRESEREREKRMNTASYSYIHFRYQCNSLDVEY